MNGRSAGGRWAVAAAWTFALFGCADSPILFRGAASVSELAPDERVVVGQLRFTNGGLSKLLPEPYLSSWPRFTYDYKQLQAPRYEQPLKKPPFGAEGGVFAFRAKQRPVYLDSVMAETLKLVGDHVLWTLPVTLKVPPATARCAYVGTIVIDISGGPAKKPSAWETFNGVELPRNQVHATVVDDFDRDRAVLASYVQGCELQRALAERPSDAELRPFHEAAEAKQKEQASGAHWTSESDRLRKH
jgi:hypothetical protein